MAAPFLYPCVSRGKKKMGNIHPLKGSMWQAEGRSVCKLSTHAVCMYPQPAPLCFSCPVLSPATRCTCQTWPRGEQESTSWITCTANTKAVCKTLSNVTWLQPLPPIHQVLLVSFPKLLSSCWEAVPEQTEIPLTWGHGPKFYVGDSAPNELYDRCCRYLGMWCRQIHAAACTCRFFYEVWSP